jgi:xylulokinase
MGVNVNEVRASGGGGKSKLWKQMQADIFGLPITTTNSSEGGALGVALLAGVGTGVYKNVAEACDMAIKAKNIQQPEESNISIYSKYYELYGRLYNSLKNDYKELSQILRGI